jgi:bilin biosynthesis protein
MMTPTRLDTLVLLLILAAGCATQPAASKVPPIAVTVDQLVAQLATEETRTDARTRLLALGADAVPAMLAHARHPAVMVRWELANILGPLADPRALEAVVMNATADENPHVRWRSLWALSHFDMKAVAAALQQRLAGDNDDARWNAAVALSFFGISDAIDLLHTNVRNPDPWRRWEAINALGRVHNDETPAVLAPALQSPAEGDRKEAALSLGMVGGPKSAALLVAALGDSSPEVRWRACLSLGRVSDPATLPALRALEAKERDPVVREQLLAALRKIETAQRN